MPSSHKIRVLIVDDIAETRENIRRLLQFEGDMEVVGAARTGREAIDLSQEIKPEVVLMDINMPDMDGIVATEAIRKRLPFVQVIILSVQGDANYMRRAMLAGARDFLTKPPMIDELTSAIRRAGLIAQEEMVKSSAIATNPNGSAPITPHAGFEPVNGKIIVVYSPKGGAGTTTIATNLAVYLKNNDTQVALVDGNLQFGDVAVFLNEAGKNTILDLASRVEDLDPDIVDEVMVKHSSSGVHILAAPSRPEQAEKVNGEQFGKVLSYLKNFYHYVIVDTTPYLTDVVLSAIDLADLFVLLTTQEIPAIKSTKAFLSLADAIQLQRERIVFVMSRYNRQIAISPEKVGESLKHEISIVIPLDEKVVMPGVNRGVPFMLEAGKTQPVGKGITGLADLIKVRLEKLDTPELAGKNRL